MWRVRDRAGELRATLGAHRISELWSELRAARGFDATCDSADKQQAVGLASISQQLFNAQGAAELFAAYAAVSAAPQLFRVLNSGDALVLEAPAQGAPGAQADARVQGFIRRVRGYLRRRHGLEVAPVADADEMGAEDEGGEGWDPDGEDGEMLGVLENVALGTVSSMTLPRPVQLLLAAFSRAESLASSPRAGAGAGAGARDALDAAGAGGALGSGRGATVAATGPGGGAAGQDETPPLHQIVASLLVRVGRWRQGENIHLRRSAHELHMPAAAEAEASSLVLHPPADAVAHLRRRVAEEAFAIDDSALSTDIDGRFLLCSALGAAGC